MTGFQRWCGGMLVAEACQAHQVANAAPCFSDGSRCYSVMSKRCRIPTLPTALCQKGRTPARAMSGSRDLPLPPVEGEPQCGWIDTVQRPALDK